MFRYYWLCVCGVLMSYLKKKKVKSIIWGQEDIICHFNQNCSTLSLSNEWTHPCVPNYLSESLSFHSGFINLYDAMLSLEFASGRKKKKQVCSVSAAPKNICCHAATLFCCPCVASLLGTHVPSLAIKYNQSCLMKAIMVSYLRLSKWY